MRERERERERERGARRRERQALPSYFFYGKMQHDRAGPARHEDPVLPSRDVNRTQLRAGLLTTSTSANVYSEAEPLVGFCIRCPQTRVWCGGGIALSHQRAGCSGSSAVSAGGTDPRQELRLEERVIQVNRGRLGRDVDQGLI